MSRTHGDIQIHDGIHSVSVVGAREDIAPMLRQLAKEAERRGAPARDVVTLKTSVAGHLELSLRFDE